jgi:quinol-cytochrome oxidoreductase complex cytochrome b subunit
VRVAGFAQTAHFLELLGFAPVIAPLARFLAVALAFFGVWVGTATAHRLRGWRTALLPVVYLATVVLAVTFLEAVRRGAALTSRAILQSLGVTG